MQYVNKFSRAARNVLLLATGVVLLDYAACGQDATAVSKNIPTVAQGWKDNVRVYTNRIPANCKTTSDGEIYMRSLNVDRYLPIDIYDEASKSEVGRAVLNNIGHGRVEIVLYATGVISSVKDVSQKAWEGSVFVEDGDSVYRVRIFIDTGVDNLNVAVTDAKCITDIQQTY